MTEFLFPKVLIWDGKEYRTPEIHPIFNTIEDVLEEKNQLVEMTGIEPVSKSWYRIPLYKHIRLYILTVRTSKASKKVQPSKIFSRYKSLLGRI